MKFGTFTTIIFLFVLSSCKKDLTIQPDNRTVAEGYYDSAQKIEQAVIGGYVDLRRALTANYAFLMYGEARTGDLRVTVDYQQAVADQKLTSDNRFIKQLTDWGYFYDVIADANNVLDIISKADNGILSNYQRNLFRGEALALKSVAYFYIARTWGSVLSAERNEMGKRLTNHEAVTLAANLATQAKGILPWVLLNDDGIESTAITGVRFNKTAITSLLAKEQLWLGQNQDAYNLLTTTFTSAVADSLSAFGISLGADRRTEIPLKPLDAAVVNVPIDRFNAIYPTGDARRTGMYNIAADKATLIITASDVLELLPRREINLLLAEAAWRSGRVTEGKTYLTTAAAGATENYSTLTDATFADALLTERRRMLMGTGERMFDLIRFGKVSAFIPAFTAADVQNGAGWWPLSASSMKGNSLSQNSYWLSKN